jgi:ferric-dicitrate binding protein FerR (iron transport regulator)
VQLRLDTGTQVALLDSRHATLARGGVYVDSGAGADARAGDLEIDTPLGGVRHLGTQYQARLLDGSLLVAVREGRVEVDARTGSVVAMAGEQLAIADTGVTRSALPADAGQWAWIGLVTPPFSIDGKSVEAFLEWAARETGRSIDYASPAAASRAREIVLRGSVAGLTPEQAVAAVLSTTPLRLDLQRDRIRIEAPGS